MTTEANAKTQRCCGPEGCGTVGRTDCINYGDKVVPYPIRYCIGSRCMAWRQTVAYTEPRGMSAGTESAGYCGYAGKP